MQPIQISRRSLLLFSGGLVGGWLISSCRQATSTPQKTIFISKPKSPISKQQTTEHTADSLPIEIATIFQSGQTPNNVFTELMPAVVEALQCDRTFLYIRDPQRQRTSITHGYSRDNRWPTMVQSGWSDESPSLNAKDPLTASAYKSPEAKFIDDIETAAPDTLDLAMERAIFGHRALVHAPIYYEGIFYGIVEPCVFDKPRIWSERDLTLITTLQSQLGSWIVRYLANL
ncbi:MAG: GAF domain-containing protein [Leptolyngbya sp. SIO3F4]|nr:GAF domain-containing protein [Leptolyngbya sp. SIO3F4]